MTNKEGRDAKLAALRATVEAQARQLAEAEKLIATVSLECFSTNESKYLRVKRYVRDLCDAWLAARGIKISTSAIRGNSMTTRRITAHKGGRTARAPEARIRPQTLQRIRATMQQRKASFGDLLEEQYSGGNEMADKKEYEYRYYEDGELYDNTAPGEFMTADEAKKRNRDLDKLPDSFAVSRKWIRTSK